MKTLKLLTVVIVTVTAVASCTSPPSGDIADTVYTNGKIYTVNTAQPWAEAVAIKDGKFLAVGSTADVETVTGDGTEVVDLGGKFVMPGIVDMHAHPFTGVDMGTGGVSIDAMDPDTILETVRQFAAANPDRDVILGGNWSIGGLFENDSPDKKLLDEIVPDVPVFLLSQSGYSAWMNSKALELAGIDETVDNEGSYIFDRYPGTNEPSGTARDNGMVLVMNALHYLAPEDFAPFLETEIERYSRYGVTAIQPAEGSITWLQGAALLEQEGRLDVRLFPALDWLTSQLRVLDDEESLAFIDDWESYQTELIRPHYVKIFGDGGADSHTILMKEPFADYHSRLSLTRNHGACPRSGGWYGRPDHRHLRGGRRGLSRFRGRPPSLPQPRDRSRRSGPARGLEQGDRILLAHAGGGTSADGSVPQDTAGRRAPSAGLQRQSRDREGHHGRLRQRFPIKPGSRTGFVLLHGGLGNPADARDRRVWNRQRGSGDQCGTGRSRLHAGRC